MNESIFDKLDFGPLRALLDNDDITDISFDNNGQIWVRSLTQGSLRVEVKGATPEFVEKLAFQCSNVMGTTFNNAKPFLDAESAELRLNFVHSSIATNGIAMVIRKTPAKIRLQKEKLLAEDYFTQDIHDVLIKCVEGHCNIIVAGETGSGKTEFVKYLASHTKTSEKIITIEDTLELHLDKIFPQRDIVSMKTNNVASYTDVLVTCMRQNPKWILLSEVRSAEAVSAVRNSISSGHNILSTIHADKASAIPYRLYSLMETDLDVNQFLSTIYRYVQLGVHIRAYYSKERGKFHREVDEVVEFYVDENNQPQSRTIYQKTFGNEPILRKPSKHLIEYLENQNIDITAVTDKMVDDFPFENEQEVDSTYVEATEEYTQSAEEVESSTQEDAYEEEQVVYETVNDQEIDESSGQVVENEEEPEEQATEQYMVTENSVEQKVNEIPKDENINIPLAGLTNEVQEAIATENANVMQNYEAISQFQPVPVQNVVLQPQTEVGVATTVEITTPVQEISQIPVQQQVVNMQQPVQQPQEIVNQQIMPQVAQSEQQMVQQVVSQQPAMPEQVVQSEQQMVQQVISQQPAMPEQVIQPVQDQQLIQQMGVPANGILPFIAPTNGVPPVGVA